MTPPEQNPIAYQLNVDFSAPNRFVPVECLSDPPPATRPDPCYMEVPLREVEGVPPQYVRFDRQGDSFVVSPQNNSDLYKWATGAQSIAGLKKYAGDYIAAAKAILDARPAAKKPSLEFEGDPTRVSIQAAIGLGGSVESPVGSDRTQTDFAVGFGGGFRYFNHKLLGPLGFGLGLHYWGVPHDEAEDGDNAIFVPRIGLQPVDGFPFDISAGPVLGLTEAQPGQSGFEFTTGGNLQINIGYPAAWGGPYLNLDILNIDLNLLARPDSETHPLGGTFLFGLNPVGIINAFLMIGTNG